MNNKYKEVFSYLSPSEKSVEKIYQITTDKKKFNYKKVIKRIAAATMALALVIGGGVGIDFIAKTNQADNTLGIYVAYAAEKELTRIEKLNEQDLFYRIYVIDYSNAEKRKKIEADYNTDNRKQQEIAHELGSHGIGTSIQRSFSAGNNGMIRTLNAGEFVLNLDDYSDVKNIIIENTSKYGQIQFSYIADSSKSISHADCVMKINELYSDVLIQSNRITITGEELQYSKNSDMYIMGSGKHEIKKGYSLNWDITTALYEELEKDMNYDLTQIQDTITVTVNYLDGTTDSAVVNLNCDKDGYIHLSNRQ